jgi:hypothetical protein
LEFINSISVAEFTDSTSDQEMNWYMVFLKVDPNHTNEVVQQLQRLNKNPMPDIDLQYCHYVFGTWDTCLWFQAESHDNAMNFVQKYIRPIPWVTETNVLPTTMLKEYK